MQAFNKSAKLHKAARLSTVRQKKNGELINVEVVKTKVRDITAPDARTLVREVQDTGETIQGVRPADLLFVPDVNKTVGPDETVQCDRSVLPFPPRRELARIAALFRRAELAAEPHAAEERLERGDLALDLKRFVVRWRGSVVPLTLTEFWMVHALAKHPEHVKSREQLMRDANLVVDEGTITSHVKRMRRKFLAVDPAFDAIDTVYGIGYRWKP